MLARTSDDLAPHLPWIAAALTGLFVGWLITWLVGRSARGRIEEQLKAEGRRATDFEARLVQADEAQEQEEREETREGASGRSTTRAEAGHGGPFAGGGRHPVLLYTQDGRGRQQKRWNRCVFRFAAPPPGTDGN